MRSRIPQRFWTDFEMTRWAAFLLAWLLEVSGLQGSTSAEGSRPEFAKVNDEDALCSTTIVRHQTACVMENTRFNRTRATSRVLLLHTLWSQLSTLQLFRQSGSIYHLSAQLCNILPSRNTESTPSPSLRTLALHRVTNKPTRFRLLLLQLHSPKFFLAPYELLHPNSVGDA